VSKSGTILRNVASNWTGFAVNAAVTLALTPFVLRHLGTAGYGIWVLTASIIGYYGLLDLGFRAGVTQYLTRYLAAGDYVKGSECMSIAVVALGTLGVLLGALSVVAAYFAPSVFNLSPGMEHEAFWCILIVGSSSAIQFALQPFTSIFTALQRFDLANFIGVGTRLLTAAGVVVVLNMGFGLIGVAAATCSTSVIDYVIRWHIARRLAPNLEVSLKRPKIKRLREIGSFGGWNFLISLNGYVYQHVPSLLIASLMPIAAVGYYALATGLSRQVNSVLNPVGQVVYPTAASMDVQGDKRGLERLYHDGSRLMILIMITVVLISMFWAEDFYRLWIGEKYVVGAVFQPVQFLFQILLLSTFTNFSNIGGQILMGAGRIRLVAVALICGSLMNLSLSLLLVGKYGLVGVAAATVIASIVVDLIAMPLLVQAALGLSAKTFVRRVWPRPLAVLVLQAFLIGLIRMTGAAENWYQLILQGCVATIGSVAVVLLIGLDSTEMQRFILCPLRRFWRKRDAIREARNV
jgi:O-antigen/teichoic acid export membrane protein